MQHCRQFIVLPLMIGLFCGSVYAADDDSASGLEEIVVTAVKGESQTMLKTPLAINVVTGPQIEEKGVTSLMDALTATPGLAVSEATPGTLDLNIRGIASAVGDPTVGLYIDDLAFFVPPTTVAPNVNPYDLDRVEVLRGPQGTLYGAGAMGGVIRVLTAKPQTDQFHASATLGGSSADHGGVGYKAQGMLNFPIVQDKLAVRISGGYVKTPGYVDLPLAGEKNFNTGSNTDIRTKVLYTPTSNAELGFSFWHSDIQSHANYSDKQLNFYAKNDIFDGPTLFTTGALVDVGDRPLQGSRLKNDVKFDFYTGHGSVDLGAVDLYGTASYGKLSFDTGGYEQGPVALTIGAKYKTRSAEARATYKGSDRFGATVGGFYLKSEGNALTTVGLFTNMPGLERIDSVASHTDPIISDQYAFFGETHYYLIPDILKLTGGLRYFHDKRTQGERSPAGIAVLNSLGYPLDSEKIFTATTKRLNLSYTPTSNVNIYANYAEGFRSGNLQAGLAYVGALQDGAPLATKPDDVTSYEAGLKVRTLDGKLSFELTGYYWKWKDIGIALTTILHPPFGTGPSTYFDNAGGARSHGLDFAATYTGIRNLSLSVSGNVNDNKYTTDQPRAGMKKGDQPTFASKYNLAASANWRKELGPDLTGVVDLSYSLMGPLWSYGPFQPAIKSDPVHIVDLRVGAERGPLRVSLYATNLLDSRRVSFVLGEAVYLLGGAPQYQRPRTIGLDMTLKY